MTVKYVFEVRAKPGEVSNILLSFDIYKRTSGFIKMEILEDPDYQDRIFCIEEWLSEIDHKRFVASLTQKEQAEWLSRFVGAPQLHGKFVAIQSFGKS